MRQQIGHRNQRTHVKGIVFAHLTHKLLANPSTNQGPTFLIEPPELLYGPDDPPSFTLLGQHVSQASIVRGSPKSKVEEEKEFAGSGRQCIIQDELEREEAEVEDVDV